MHAPRTIGAWLRQLLPQAGPCAWLAAHDLLQALFAQFTTDLCQLARQLPREPAAKSGRQYLARWLDRPHWDPALIYTDLNRQAQRRMARRGSIPLLVDFTPLGTRWTVLQVSFPWQGRALPLYRLVFDYREPEVGQKDQVRQACAFLREQLPAPVQRYVLVMDRGFPSNVLIRELGEADWRFVLRIKGEWKMTHANYSGQLKAAAAQPGLVGPRPRLFRAAILGQRGKGRASGSEANVVSFHGAGYQAPWFLVTGERHAGRAVAFYRARMRIEGEFRDLKGPYGLDELARWEDQARVARFLALIAVYEWWLAWLWVKHRLDQWAPRLTVKGKLSWMRVTREWLQRQLRPATNLALDFL
jgi:Transposase DDE domain